jgi:hypothetical protein
MPEVRRAIIRLTPPFGKTKIEKVRKKLATTPRESDEHRQAFVDYIALSLRLYPDNDDPFMTTEGTGIHSKPALEGDDILPEDTFSARVGR